LTDPKRLIVTIAAGLLPLVAFAQTKPDSQPEGKPTELERMRVEAEPWLYNSETRYAHSLPELVGTRITVTKKTSVVDLDNQPTLPTVNPRGLFATVPGVQISDQQAPTQLNLNYRGIGNPQESEYVLAMQDGVPLMSDWIGFPTLYFIPQAQSLDRVELIRGGSSLLYGPEPGPAINFVSRFPEADAPLSGMSQHVFGPDATYDTYNSISGNSGPVGFRVNGVYRTSDGERDNGDYDLANGGVLLGWHIDDRQTMRLDLHAYNVNSGLPGRQTYAQFRDDPDTTPNPFDREWVTRYWATLSYDRRGADDSRLTAKVWGGYHDQTDRSVNGSATQATISSQTFHFYGMDLRYLQPWGEGSAWTLGATAYHSTSPWRRFTSDDINAGRDFEGGFTQLDQARATDYAAVFGEVLWRLSSFHVVASGRLEHEKLDINEKARPPFLGRDLIDRGFSRSVPLFGFGIGNDFGRGNETYLNISQGYRPLRYFDVASPFGNLGAQNDPDPSKSLTYEMGVHGWPRQGLYYDVSVFRTGFENRLESRHPSADPTVVVNVNTGDTRHEGLEFEGHYDLFNHWAASGDRHLELFFNASWLHATFTDSDVPDQVGKRPAFAPQVIARAGLNYRDGDRASVRLSVQSTGRQFWQDSNQGAGDIPAEIPGYTVVDLNADWQLVPHWKLLAGVSNLTDRRYFSRVWLSGIDPAPGRRWYLGVSASF